MSMLCVSLFLFTYLSPGSHADEGTPPEASIEERVRDAVEAVRLNPISHTPVLNLGAEAIPALLHYMKDDNQDVRLVVVSALSRWPREDDIPVLMEAVQADPDSNVRGYALRGLSKWPRGTLRKHSSKAFLDGLQACLEEGSQLAGLLLGDLGDRRNIEAIRNVYEKLRQANIWVGRERILREDKAVCLKALVKLGDKDAIDEAIDLLKGDDVTGVVLGLECFEYSRREELLKNVVALLDDGKNAVDISGIPGHPIVARVRDVTVDVLVRGFGVEYPFPLPEHRRKYTDEEVEQVRQLIQNLGKKGLRGESTLWLNRDEPVREILSSEVSPGSESE